MALIVKPGSFQLQYATPESLGFDSARLTRLTGYMKSMVEAGKVAGATTLLMRHGKVVDFSCHGKADLRAGKPMAKDTIFRIYSMTKPVTGVAMMTLFEEGLWQLDDLATKFIPQFGALRVMTGVAADGSIVSEPVKRAPTLREIMSHTAGFGYGLFAAHAVDKLYRERRVLAATSLADMIQRTADIPLMFPPGSDWSYSNAVDIQGHLVEVMSGMKFGEFLKERIFQPLGMVDTGFHVPSDQVHRLAAIYAADQRGVLQESKDFLGMPANDFLQPPKLESGGGGLVSTAEDYARFCQMVLNKGELGGARILAPSTIELMATNVIPQSVFDSPQGTRLINFSEALGFGLDFMVNRDPRTMGAVEGKGTLSWGGGGGTWFWIDPSNDLLFVGLIQRIVDLISGEFRAKARTFTYQALTNPDL